MVPGGLQRIRRCLSVEAKTLVTMGSFGEGARFFGDFGRAGLKLARNGEGGAERGDVFGAFRPGVARRGEIFS